MAPSATPHPTNGANSTHTVSKSHFSDIVKDSPDRRSHSASSNGTRLNGDAGSAHDVPEPLERRPDATALTRHPNIVMLRNTPKGRAVFATAFIPARTLLDITPVLVFEPEEYERYVGRSKVWFYSFTWPERAKASSSAGNVDESESEKLRLGKSVRQTQAMPLGLGALFNHASVSSAGHNVGFVRDVEEEVIRYVTLRDVQRGEELCICYGDDGRLGFANADGSQDEMRREDDFDGFGGFAGVGEIFD